MRAQWILGALAAGAVTVAGLVGGCMIVTGSTDGYSLFDSGPAEASATPECTLVSDGGVCLFGQCQSAGDCAGDASGEVCCLGEWSTSEIGTRCQSACGFSFVQVCKADDECGEKSCVYQACRFGPDEVDLHACGLQTGCSRVAPGAPDGGAPDGAATDGGPLDSGGAHDSGSVDGGPPDGGASDANTLDAQLDGAG